MIAKQEIKSLINRYGINAVIEAMADIINDEACHRTDQSDEEGREVFDEAYNALMLCVE